MGLEGPPYRLSDQMGLVKHNKLSDQMGLVKLYKLPDQLGLVELSYKLSDQMCLVRPFCGALFQRADREADKRRGDRTTSKDRSTLQ